RDRLYGARARARQGVSDGLAARHRRDAGRRRALCAQRHPWHCRNGMAPLFEGRAMTAALETLGLCKSFGALEVARSIDFRLQKGARHALIGPNGAGKTTFVNLLTGVERPSGGRVLLGGEDVTALPQAKRVKRGIARIFQINQLFRGLSVLDNVCIAVAERLGVGGALLKPAGRRADVLENASRLIEMVKLQADAGRRVAELP